jgi:hypothetical protein
MRFLIASKGEIAAVKRALLVLIILTVVVPCWALTGKVVDNKGRPVAKASVGIWTFWTSGKTYHADNYGGFIFSRNISPDGTVYLTSYRILGADGKPVPKATVVLPWSNDAPIRLVTDRNGGFRFDIPGKWDGVIRVMDSAGAPIPRAKLVRSWMAHSRPDETVTDDKGEYRIEGWQPDAKNEKECNVNVLADGYAYWSRYVHPERERRVVIKLQPERLFRARIVGDDGAPLGGARVITEDATGKMKNGDEFSFAGFDMPVVRTISGKDGSFELHHLPNITSAKSALITLTIDAPGRARIERRAYDVAKLAKSGKITLPRACSVQGTVRPPDGKKLLDDLLLTMKLTEDGPPTYESERSVGIDKEGRFKFDNLPPGEATIVLWTQHRRTIGWSLPAVQPLRITPGEVKNLELAGATGAVISGIVRDKTTGNPIPGAALTVEDPGNPRGNWWVTEKDGTYSIRVAPGKVTVYVDFIWAGDKQVKYDRKEGITVEVADGQDKTGQDLSIALPAK